MKLRQLVLVAEPSKTLASAMHAGLRAKGFDVTSVHLGRDVVSAARSLACDVIVLSEKLVEVADAELRATLISLRNNADLPLIVYRANVIGRARQGFVIDPSLYPSEPVTLSRFCQRVSALSRPRSTRVVAPELRADVLRVDTVAHRVYVEDREVSLTALEFRLLVAFMSAGDRVLSREGLLLDVWGIRSRDATRTIDTNVKRLRQKLGRAAHLIETLRNVGYRFARGPRSAERTKHSSGPNPARNEPASPHTDDVAPATYDTASAGTAVSGERIAYAGRASAQGASGTLNDNGASPAGDAS